jgi:hypothetical protein
MEKYSIYKKAKVKEILKLTEMGTLDVRNAQRIFNYNYDDMMGIIESVINKEMFTPAIIGDMHSSLEHAIKTNNKSDIKYFNQLIDKGILYTIEDSQHRFKYYHLAKRVLTEEGYNQLLESEIPVYYLYKYNSDELTKLFGNANSGNKIKTHDLIWSIINDFNEDLKLVAQNSNLSNFSKLTKNTSKIRNSYKIFLKGIKTCAYNEKMYGIDKQVGDKGLIKFVSQNYRIHVFQSIIMCFHTTISMLNRLNFDNKNEDYTTLNLLFTIHVIKYSNYKFDENWILRFVNQINTIDGKNNSGAHVPKRYDYIKKQLDYYFQPQIQFN